MTNPNVKNADFGYKICNYGYKYCLLSICLNKSLNYVNNSI